MKKPVNNFSVVKRGLQLNRKPEYILAKTGFKDVHLLTSLEKGETISVIICCSAGGHFQPLARIFKSANKKQEFEKDLPPDSAIIM
jgi:hypothetical protein